MVEAKHTPRQWLETAVQPDLAEELLKHRQRLRKPLTDFAAKLLANKLKLCSDPDAAACMMIEKGWQSIEPKWIENAERNRNHSPRQDSAHQKLMRGFGV